MSTEGIDTTSSQSSIQRLVKIVDDVEPVLDQTTFLSRELPGEQHERKATVARLKVCGAIKSEGMKRVEGEETDDEYDDSSYVNQWRWVQHRERLKEYLDDRDELPCGCRSHVPPETDDQGNYVCKFCGATHDAETIKEAL